MLKYLILGVVIFLAVSWFGRRWLKLPTWRIGSAVLSMAFFAGAFYALLRNQWGAAAVMGVLGAWLSVSARFPRPGARPAGSRPPATTEQMSASQARSMLGVSESATAAEIKEAYSRLMQRVHPDKGGAAGLAAQLNAARDRLLKGK